MYQQRRGESLSGKDNRGGATSHRNKRNTESQPGRRGANTWKAAKASTSHICSFLLMDRSVVTGPCTAE